MIGNSAANMMRSEVMKILPFITLIAALAQVAFAAPENLALRATASANSEFSNDYLAKFACDGKIPAANGSADLKSAWCVRGDTHRDGAEFSLAWPAPVSVAEIVYYGRTAWMLSECWKDFQVFADGGATPVASGTFEMRDGPQRIKLASPVRAGRITMKFSSSFGGMNPGASEIMAFSESPPDGSLPGEIVSAKDSKELAEKIAGGKFGFKDLLLIQRHPINSSHVYTYHVEGFQSGGALCVMSPGGAVRKLVDAGDGQILDCDLSFDAKKILFSWRKNKDSGYHLFTINADGSNLRQLTDGRWHDYNACWLPDGGIAFLSTRAARFAYCWISPVGVLHRMDEDGSNVRRLSANIVNDFTPSVLDDGRVIYSRWEYVDKPAIPIQSLWTINPDGTALAGFYGNGVLSPATFMEARAIPGSSKIICLMTAHNGPASGAIGVIDRSRGMNAQDSIQNLTPEIDIGKVDHGSGNNVHGPYATPYPLDGSHFLVSKSGAIIARNFAGTEEAKLIAPRDGMGFFNPQPIRPRAKPPLILSSLKTNDEKWATVFIQDVYRGLEPVIARGEVKEICVVQEMEKDVRVDVANRAFGFQFPVISCGATYAGKKVWGYAPVEADGSAYFKVPAGVPIYFMTLDAQGRAVQRMRTFTHLMPGEVQGCVGCHDPRLGTSASTPRGIAMKSPPRELRAPGWGQGIGFDYSLVVQPVLDQHCVKCHASPDRVDLAGDKTDFFSVSYETLARGRKHAGEGEYDNPFTSWIPTYNGMEANILQIAPKTWGSPRSKLADLILDGHRDTNGTPRVQMDETSQRRIFAWIDLNVPYYGTSETAYPKNKGCRRMYPADLDRTLADVAARRCADCHAGGKYPREVWTRITKPELNRFLLAPLAKTAGGTGACGKAIFSDANDPDYQKILRAFDPVIAMLKDRPRDDMPGSKPDELVCRDTQ